MTRGAKVRGDKEGQRLSKAVKMGLLSSDLKKQMRWLGNGLPLTAERPRCDFG